MEGEGVVIPENWKEALPEDVRGHEALAGINDLPGLASEFLKVRAAAGDWKAGLVDELKNDPSIAQIKDINSMAKSFVHAQRMVGANRVAIPGAKATPDEWEAFYKAVGRPDSPDGYDIPGPKDESAPGYEDIKQYREACHKLGLRGDQAAGMLEFLTSLGDAEFARAEASFKQEREHAEAALRQEWGQAYDAKLATVKRLVHAFCDDDARKAIEDDMGNSPALLKFCERIGAKLLEDDLLGGGGDGGALSPTEAKAKVDAIMRDKKHPYHNASTPGHAEAVREVQKLYEQMYPTAA